MGGKASRQVGRQVNRQAGRQVCMQAGRQTGRQAGRQVGGREDVKESSKEMQWMPVTIIYNLHACRYIFIQLAESPTVLYACWCIQGWSTRYKQIRKHNGLCVQ